MKKFRNYTKVMSLFLIILSLFSCKNFLQGSLIKDQLEDEIEYANAPTFTVYISPENASSGTLISASVKENCKVTDYIQLDFNLADGYKFLCWQAVQRSDTSVSLDEYVSFGDSRSLQTTVKIVEADDRILNNDLLIRPVASSTCYFVSCLPDSTALGVARDSSIQLKFSNLLSEDNDLESIELSIDNGEPIEWDTYFSKPCFFEDNRDILLITANSSNRVNVAVGDIKKISVKIPETITYDTAIGKEEIGISLEYVYYINSTTKDKTLVTSGLSDEDAGSIRVNGQSGTSFSHLMSVGDEMDIFFKINEGFRFKGVTKSQESVAALSLPEDMDNYTTVKINGISYLYNPLTRTYAIHLKSVDYVQNLILTAVTAPIQKRAIKVFSDEGNISPNNTEQEYFEEAEIPLVFIANADVCFIKWKVFLGNEEVTELDKYIHFADISEGTTTATFVNAPDNAETKTLMIKPYCVARPNIISNTPTFNNEGVLRDSSIQLWFDHDMSLDSIYYEGEYTPGQKISDPELKDVESYRYLWTELTTEDNRKVRRVYGYRDPDNNYVFKNIKIVDNYTKKNVLDYFGAPVFEAPDILVIPVKKGHDYYTDNDYDGLPSNSQIMVEVSKNLNYKVENNKEVQMTTAARWVYLVNGNTDEIAPTISSELSLKRVSNKFDVNTNEVDLQTSTGTNITWLKKAYLDKDNQFVHVKFTVNDSGSGPSSVASVVFHRVKGECGADISGSGSTYRRNILLSGVGTAKSYDGMIDVTTIKETGVYQVYFDVMDNNSNKLSTENESTKHYVYIDCTGPRASTISYTATADSASQITLKNITRSTTPIDISDIKNVTIGGKKTDVTSTTAVSVTGLTQGTDYDCSFEVEDIFGNTATVTGATKVRTCPGVPAWKNSGVVPMSSATTYGSVNVECTKPTGNNKITRLYYSTSSTKPAKTSTSYISLSNGASSGTLSGSALKKGTYYYFWIAEEDDEGNVSDLSSSYKATYLQPANLAAFSVTAATTNSVTLSWTKSSTGTTTGANVEYKKHSDSTWTNLGKISGVSKTISSLTANTAYDFRVKAYNSSGLFSYSTESTSQYTAPQTQFTSDFNYIENGYGKVWFSFVVDDSDTSNIHGLSYSINNGSYMDVNFGTTSASDVRWVTGAIRIPSYNSSNTYTLKVKLLTTNVLNKGIENFYSTEKTISIRANSNKESRVNYGNNNITSAKDYIFTSSTSNHNYILFKDGTVGSKEINLNYLTTGNVTMKNYQLGTYEVTNRLYNAVMLRKGGSTTDLLPVSNVTWMQCILFCNKLSRILDLTPAYLIYKNSSNFYSNDTWDSVTHDNYLTYRDFNNTDLFYRPYFNANDPPNGIRLPTESEWEYAALCLTNGFDGAGFTYVGKWPGATTEANVDAYAWCNGNSDSKKHEVGTKSAPWAYGYYTLYDMAGNVTEWVWDYWTTLLPHNSLTGPSSNTGNFRVVKGGNYTSTKNECKISWRDYWYNSDSNRTAKDSIGFRIARTRTNNDLDKK